MRKMHRGRQICFRNILLKFTLRHLSFFLFCRCIHLLFRFTSLVSQGHYLRHIIIGETMYKNMIEETKLSWPHSPCEGEGSLCTAVSPHLLPCYLSSVFETSRIFLHVDERHLQRVPRSFNSLTGNIECVPLLYNLTVFSPSSIINYCCKRLTRTPLHSSPNITF